MIGKAPRVDVQKQDLAHIDALLELLQALNDPQVSTYVIERLVSKIEPLKTRCIRMALAKRPKATVSTAGQALAILGNRGLESSLLELLEDLTVLKAELEAEGT